MKKLPPITIIALLWAITSIPIYKIDCYGVALPHYTLYFLLNAAFFFGYFRREELSSVVKLTITLCLVLWFMQCWLIFSNIFPLDLQVLVSNQKPTTLLLFNTFLVFFFSALVLSPLMVGTFGKYSIKMVFLLSLPVLIITSSIDLSDFSSIFLSLALIVTKLASITLAINLTYLLSQQCQKKSRGFYKNNSLLVD